MRSSDLRADMQQWRWKRRRTNFHVTVRRPKGRVERYFFPDVRFRKTDIVRLTGEMTKFFRERYQGGRRFNEKRWGVFWVELAILFRDGKIGPAQMKSLGAFQRAVFEAYARTSPTEPLAFETVSTVLAEAYEILSKNSPAALLGDLGPK